MRLFLRYIIKSMIENKKRLFLLIFSGAISTALLVASLGAVNVVFNIYENSFLAGSEGNDIVITGTDDNLFFETQDINFNNIADWNAEINDRGFIDNANEIQYVILRGKSGENIEKLYSTSLIKGEVKKFEGESCIISKRISDLLDLDVGEYLKFYLYGEERSYEVKAVVANSNAFYSDIGSQFTVIVPYENLSQLLDCEGKYNVIYAKGGGDKLSDSLDTFNDLNDDFSASKMYDKDAVNDNFSSLFVALYIVLMVICVICIVIIKGAFKLIMCERLPIIGTFMSQGATKWKIKYIIYMESLIYGVIGGIIGDILGCVILYIINYVQSPLKDYGIVEKFSINVSYVGIGFLFAILMSMITATAPIRSINKMPVKDIILNTINVTYKNIWFKFITGVVFTIASLLMIYFTSSEPNGIVIISFIALNIGIIMIIPKAVSLLSLLFSLIFKKFSRASAFLAANNLGTSQLLLSNALLIFITFTTGVVCVSTGDAIVRGTGEAYTKLVYDISITNIIENNSGESTTQMIIDDLEQNQYVIKDSINPIMNSSGNIEGLNLQIYGVQSDNYRDYMVYLDLNEEGNKSLFDQFSASDGKVIIVTDTVLHNINKEAGDTIPVKINDIESDFTLLGSIDGKLYNTGSFALLPYDDFQNEFNKEEASNITCMITGNIDEARVDISSDIKTYGATLTTKKEDFSIAQDNNNLLMLIFEILSFAVILISNLGIYNSISIGYIQRKKSIAMYSAIGMSNGRKSLMLILESLFSVLMAAVLIGIFSLPILKSFSNLMKVVGLKLEITLDPITIPMLVGFTLIVIFITTLPVVLAEKRASIIDELKYE